MRKVFLVSACLAIFVGLLFCSNLKAQAAPPALYTPFPTPTPNPEGRIIYIVQPGDSLWRISAITGVSLDQIRSLNHLGTNDQITPNQPLLLAIVNPPEATPPTLEPLSSPTPALPTPSPQPGSGTLCILVYDDSNGDSIRQEEELSIPGGAISVSDRSGKTSLTETTITGSEPMCFKELAEGEYNISVAVPDGYNPTTEMNYLLSLEAGGETYLNFGAQLSSQGFAELPPTAESGKSPLLGILGALVFLGGVGLAIFAGRLVRGERKVGDEK